jgi:hypothetical protein
MYILYRWGMTIDQRDDEGGEEQDDAVVELMQVCKCIIIPHIPL